MGSLIMITMHVILMRETFGLCMCNHCPDKNERLWKFD